MNSVVQGKSFLSSLDVTYGPRDVLGRFFLAADAAAVTRGVHLRFGTFDDLIQINAANRQSWLPILPTYDPTYSIVGPGDFCLIGYNEQGVPVATHATRIFDIPDSSFRDHAESLRIFYSDPSAMRRLGESCQVTAQMAKEISGKVYFGGAAWYHPKYRGIGLGNIIPRISRALALTQSSVDWIVGIMAEKVVQGGLAHRSGYRNIQWEMLLENASVGRARCALTWMSQDELIDDLATYVHTMPLRLVQAQLSGI